MMYCGEKHHAAKLTAEDVKAIRLDPRSNREIAADYGVSNVTIHSVKTGKLWRHVESEMPSFTRGKPGTRDLGKLVYDDDGIDIHETCKLLGMSWEEIYPVHWEKGCVEDRIKQAIRNRTKHGERWFNE